MLDKKLKKEMELLYGGNLREYEYESIPCRERSDSNLCATPLVSVLMLAYNHKAFIKEAIKSIVEQQCDFDFELIIGEDCSTDETREIVALYQENYPHIIRVIYSENNVGIMQNFMRCICRSRGRYIAFCEGDDYWTDIKKLSQQVAILQKYPEVKLVYGECGRIINGNAISAFPSQDRIECYFEDALRFGTLSIRTLTVMVDAEVIRALLNERSLYMCDLRVWDYTLWLTATEHHKHVYHMGNQLGMYRIHSGGISFNPERFAELEKEVSVIRYFFMVHSTLFNMKDAFRIAELIYVYKQIFCFEQKIKRDNPALETQFKALLNHFSEETENVQKWLIPFFQKALRTSFGYKSFFILRKFMKSHRIGFYVEPLQERMLRYLTFFFDFSTALHIYYIWVKFRIAQKKIWNNSK